VSQREAKAAAPVSSPPVAGAPNARPGERLRRLGRACRQVFGIPDYERYLEHMAAHHLGEPVLPRREFFARAIDRKYGKSGPRCC
jgi:uncharacterized short protein YbdD (DUF466 family)